MKLCDLGGPNELRGPTELEVIVGRGAWIGPGPNELEVIVRRAAWIIYLRIHFFYQNVFVGLHV
jgi:hypothetical protein